MKIHYISDHSILEYDEVQMFLNMGHEVFSNGAYLDPAGHITLPRPGLIGAKYYEEYANIARTTPHTDIPDSLLDPFDLIIFMHQPHAVVQNWPKLKGRNVIWRSIGQSTAGIEKKLAEARSEGLKIVRYSPKEANIPGFIGEDAMIRFYKDENQYRDWNGNDPSVVSFAQSLKGRRMFCHYDEIIHVIREFKGKVYGPGNDDLGEFNGGQVPYDMQQQIMRDSRVMIYGGTWPASYTLSFVEALMTGLPIVAISKQMAHIKEFEPIDFYEVDEILAEAHGAVCDSPQQMVKAVHKLLTDKGYADDIARQQRAVAIKYFSRGKIEKQWNKLFREFK